MIDLAFPTLKLLAQRRTMRICGAELFCPHQRCEAEIRNVSHLMTHVRTKHDTRREACADRIVLLIRTIMPRRISYKLLNETGKQTADARGMSSTATTRDASASKGTIRTSKFTFSSTKSCGETSKHSSGSGERVQVIGTRIEKKPGPTIGEVMRIGEVYECSVAGCHGLFSSMQTVRLHFSKSHGDMKTGKHHIVN
jgi:hypothetical protein